MPGIDLGPFIEQLLRSRGGIAGAVEELGLRFEVQSHLIPLHWRSRRRRRSLQARPFSSRGGRNIASLAACRVTPPGGFLLSPPPSSPALRRVARHGRRGASRLSPGPPEATRKQHDLLLREERR